MEQLLSHRQYDCLRLMALLGTRKEVGHELGISMHTVRNHLTDVYRALGVEDGTHAAMLAAFRRLGWLKVPDAPDEPTATLVAAYRHAGFLVVVPAPDAVGPGVPSLRPWTRCSDQAAGPAAREGD